MAMIPCMVCSGDGVVEQGRDCPTCNGSGEVEASFGMTEGHYMAMFNMIIGLVDKADNTFTKCEDILDKCNDILEEVSP